MKKTAVFYAVSTILLVLNMCLIWKYRVLSNDYLVKSDEFRKYRLFCEVGFSKLPAIIATSIEGELIELDAINHEVKVLLIAHPSDCVSCVHMMLMLNRISLRFKYDVKVVALLKESSLKAARLSLRGININYPVIVDTPGQFPHGLSCRVKTPFLLIADRESNIVYFGNPYPDLITEHHLDAVVRKCIAY